MAAALSSTTDLYRRVIGDLMERVQDDFINAGMDEAILFDLRQLWEQKLLQSRVLQHEISGLMDSAQPPHAPAAQQQHGAAARTYSQGSTSSADASAMGLPSLDAHGLVMSAKSSPVPPALQSKSASPQPVAQYLSTPSTATANVHTHAHAHANNASPRATAKVPVQKEEPSAPELDDELLGSDLDDSEDEENAVDQEVPNLLLCQYEKVHRSKNKWKCVLKDGVVHANGRDYAFHRAQCDFEF